MSKKWNIRVFKKKSAKNDSHGTTLANEEIFFQATSRPGSQWGAPCPAPAETNDAKNRSSGKPLNRVVSLENNPSGTSSLANNSGAHNIIPHLSHNDLQSFSTVEDQKNNRGHSQHKNESSAAPYHPSNLVPVASIQRTSPRVTKKLIKPGSSNIPQPSYLMTDSNNTVATMSDEYTDPFDAVRTNKINNNGQSAADGYVEPYEAQQMYHDVTQASEGVAAPPIEPMYDEPWDKTNQLSSSGNVTEYEEPWDNAETLPYNQARQPGQSLFYAKTKVLSDRYGDNHTPGFQSGDSSTSSSSASVAKQRMVRVDSPRHSPRASPRSSPKLDHRLIRPNTESPSVNLDPRLQLYSVPGGGPKYKPFDQRLVKAEPSFGDMRISPVTHRTDSSKGSSRTNSPAGSSRVSPNQSPLSTMHKDRLSHLNNDIIRRASSPLVPPVNMSHYLLSKAKSRSLDIRNPQLLSQLKEKNCGFPKSASDDQLSNAVNPNQSPFRANRPLGGVTEHEEPWEGADAPYMSSIPSNVVHSRSRSYDMNYVTPSARVRHGKSRSFDKQEAPVARPLEYEQPFQPRQAPQNHLESMQRFQHRQLELHPSEAISYRDFDPLVPLNKQSWFHGLITRDEAHRRLEREAEGTYLVRNSESVPNNYSLSLRTRDDIIHMVISRTRDGFWILGEFSAPFHSVPEMISFYAAHRLKINDVQQISLTYPLPEEYL